MSPAMSSDTTTDNVKSLHNIKKLENDGRNYPTWAIRCRMVLIGLDLWDVVNPAAQTSTRPTPTPSSGKAAASTSTPAAAPASPDRLKILPSISLMGRTPLRRLGKASRLHRFQLDDSKSLEPQINEMREMRAQPATLGDVMIDAKFAMVISEALPPSYETLKTLTVATVTDVSKLASDTLVSQILREEKRRQNENTATALLVKSGKTPPKSSNSKPASPKASISVGQREAVLRVNALLKEGILNPYLRRRIES